MNFYRRWINEKELEGFRVHVGIKKKHAFNWGLEHLGISNKDGDPKELLTRFTKMTLKDSKSYFVPPPISRESYQLVGNHLSFPSTVQSHDETNNTAHCKYFPFKDSKSIIIVVPHWNAPGDKYDKICSRLNKVHFATLRMTLPYHGDRAPMSTNNSVKMVSANIGLTLQALQQCVQDIISAVSWLEMQGYNNIGVMGASIGSCAAFLAAVHDPRIKGFFANLMASYFGDVVWTGISTKHIRESLEGYVTQDELRRYWLLNSPISFIDQLKKYNPNLKQFLMIARYDTTFRYELSEQIVSAYDKENVPFKYAVLPCGHYSLGKYWFKLIDGYYIVKFFRNVFAN